MRVEGDGLSVDRLRTRTALSLLAYVLLHRGRDHSRDDLIERFWGSDDIESGRQKLRLALYSIRQALPGLLDSDRFTARVADPASVWCDYEATLRDLSKTPDSASADHASLLERTLALCTGGLMPGYYESWVVEERMRAESQAVAGLTGLVRHFVDAERWADGVAAAQALITLDPYSEIAHVSLLKSLSALGRTASVARHLKWARERYAEMDAELPPALLAFRRSRSSAESELAGPAFIGREAELAQIGERIHPGRVLTLHGPAGIGKSRLAREAFDALQERGESVVYVPLATATHAQETIAATRAAISPSDPSAGSIEEMIESLADSTLILDNLEQVAEAIGPLVVAWLQVNPKLRIVTTSQRTLGISPEEVFSVHPLDLPSPTGTAAQVAASSSARLLIERVALFGGRLVIDRQNKTAIAHLCQELEGNPLALELASEWLSVLSANDVLRRYRGSVKSLATRSSFHETRHRSLEAAIGASFGLLSPPLAALLCDLSIFVGGWSLAAAEAVCHAPQDAPPDIAAMLADLHERSLIVVDTASGRYRMLESIHSFARERLSSERADTLLRRHARYFVAWARDITENDQDNVAGKLYADNENIRRAIDTMEATEEDGAAFALSCAEFGWYWSKTAQYDEARRRMLSALDRMPEAPSPLRARVLNWVGCIAYFQCDYAEAERWFLARADVLRALGDEWGVAKSAGNLAITRNAAGDWAGALELSRQSYEAMPPSTPPKDYVVFAHNHADILLNNGQVEEGLRLVHETMDISVRNDLVAMIGLGCLVMGEYLLHTDAAAEAQPYLRRATEAFVKVEEPLRIIAARTHLATAYAILGQFEASRAELRESVALLPRIGGALPLAQCAEAAANLASETGLDETACALVEATRSWRARGASVITPLNEAFIERLNRRAGERLPEPRRSQMAVWGRTWSRTELLDAIRQIAV